MARSFSAQVNDWTRKSERRLEAVIKASAQEVFEVAQTPRAKGGVLPVDTAFLRNSFRAQIGTMPSGPSGPKDGNSGEWESPVLLVIAQTRPGDALFAGWSATYARPMEDRYGFMRSAAAKWPSIVKAKVREARARIR